MSETEPAPPTVPEPLPQPRPAASPPVAATPPVKVPARRSRSFWPALGVIGFLILAGGEAYLYRLHQLIPDNSTAIAVLQAQVGDLQTDLQQAARSAQPAPDSVTVQADLAQKFANLNAQVTALTAQAASDHAAVASLAASNVDVTKITAQMTLLNSLNAARMALDAGQALGNIPNAPPALAIFATTPPPTQAALVLGYPAAARAANIASVEKLEGVSYWSKVRARLESLVTITNGSHVVIGPPAAAIVARAGQLLDAGDLGGAVAELGNLSPTTQAAMGGWLIQARALVAARSALIAMADQN
jgi:hypothetical protein